MAIVTSPVNGKEEGITIQVYSFQDRNRAATALQTLKNSGYQAFLVVSDLGEKGVWYRVRSGGSLMSARHEKCWTASVKIITAVLFLNPGTYKNLNFALQKLN